MSVATLFWTCEAVILLSVAIFVARHFMLERDLRLAAIIRRSGAHVDKRGCDRV